jgi:hypothetical protein
MVWIFIVGTTSGPWFRTGTCDDYPVVYIYVALTIHELWDDALCDIEYRNGYMNYTTDFQFGSVLICL